MQSPVPSLLSINACIQSIRRKFKKGLDIVEEDGKLVSCKSLFDGMSKEDIEKTALILARSASFEVKNFSDLKDVIHDILLVLSVMKYSDVAKDIIRMKECDIKLDNCIENFGDETINDSDEE